VVFPKIAPLLMDLDFRLHAVVVSLVHGANLMVFGETAKKLNLTQLCHPEKRNMVQLLNARVIKKCGQISF
jgi:hypothetical protein